MITASDTGPIPNKTKHLRILLPALCAFSASAAPVERREQPLVLWRNPADIGSRDLFYGPGGKAHRPTATMRFDRENLNGTQPKVFAVDRNGTRWSVKLGSEARPEVAATRLLWAVGYFSEEVYFLPKLKLLGVPRRLHRFSPESDGSVRNVRLKRHLSQDVEEGSWNWSSSPFAGTRELNGLRVMMALLNNWDATERNNAIYRNGGAQRYVVSDLGSTFGTGTLSWPLSRSRGNLATYRNSGFITRVRSGYIDFHAPGRPALFFLFTPAEYFSKLRLRAIGDDIPLADACWIGDLLKRLSPAQIRSAFRAADYGPGEAAGFARAVEARIAELNRAAC